MVPAHNARNYTLHELLDVIDHYQADGLRLPEAVKELIARVWRLKNTFDMQSLDVEKARKLQDLVSTTYPNTTFDEAVEECVLTLADCDMLLSDFLDTKYWQGWDDDNRRQFMVSDPDRGRRCWEAAGEGCDGSTHREILGDYREAVRDAVRDNVITSPTAYRLEHEIDLHELAGTLSYLGG